MAIQASPREASLVRTSAFFCYVQHTIAFRCKGLHLTNATRMTGLVAQEYAVSKRDTSVVSCRCPAGDRSSRRLLGFVASPPSPLARSNDDLSRHGRLWMQQVDDLAAVCVSPPVRVSNSNSRLASMGRPPLSLWLTLYEFLRASPSAAHTVAVRAGTYFLTPMKRCPQPRHKAADTLQTDAGRPRTVEAWVAACSVSSVCSETSWSHAQVRHRRSCYPSARIRHL